MTESDDRLVATRLFTTQIIAGSLVMGVVVFLGIACYVVYGQPAVDDPAPAHDTLPIITLVAFAMLVGTAGASLILPRQFTQTAVRNIAAGTWPVPPGTDPKDCEGDTIKLLATWQTSLIMGLAPLEGAAFTGCIAFLVERRPYALAVVAIGVVAMLMRFPTDGRLRAWLSQAGEEVNSMRQGNSPPNV